MVTQAHLSPLPVYMTPVYWSYDHALHLYPLPDLIVVCDKFKSTTDTIADCTIINPVDIHNSYQMKEKFSVEIGFICN